MRRLRGATIVTPDPAATAALYESWFDYRRIGDGEVSAAQAQAWGAPAMAGRRFVTVAPASGVPVWLRFVAGEAAPTDAGRSLGWGAIELCVRDVQAVHRRLTGSPFAVIGPPKALDGAPAIWPMQVRAPDGTVIFLTEIRADEPAARLPRAACDIDCLFIAVLGCADMAASRAWFESALALSGGPSFVLAYSTLSRAFGLPLETRHSIAVLGDEGDAFLQLDQYPPGAVPRVVAPGALPPGIAIVTLDGPAPAVLRTPEGALVELAAA